MLLVAFYGISTLVGYLMSNPVHTYIHTYTMAVLSVSNVTTSFISCPLLLPYGRSLTSLKILPQNWHNRSVLFAVTLYGCKIDFTHLRRWLLRPAKDRHIFPHMSLCWTLFTFVNQMFIKRCTAYGYCQRILCFRESVSTTNFCLKPFSTYIHTYIFGSE